MAAAVCTIRGIEKAFGPNRVLRDIALDLPQGRVTVLMGANGAGKSTLVKILCGVHAADAGDIELFGEPFRPASPADAYDKGVVTVHQSIDDGVIPDLDVASNLLLDRLTEPSSSFFLKDKAMRREAREIAASMRIEVDVRTPVSSLGVADRQMIAIARAMARKPKLMILDEPTSSLSANEAERLFELIDRLKESGVAVLYISHRMSDIRRIADRIVSMRDGRIAGVFETEPLDYEGAVTAMLGHAMTEVDLTPRTGGDAVLQLDGLRLSADGAPIDLAARQGEVLAVTGLLGSGKSRLAATLFGELLPAGGAMRLDGKPFAPGFGARGDPCRRLPVSQGSGEQCRHSGFRHHRQYHRALSQAPCRLLAAARRRHESGRRRDDRDPGHRLPLRPRRHRHAVGRQPAEGHGRPLALPALPAAGAGTNRSRASTSRRGAISAATSATPPTPARPSSSSPNSMRRWRSPTRILVLHEQALVGEHVNADVDLAALLAQVSGRTAATQSAGSRVDGNGNGRRPARRRDQIRLPVPAGRTGGLFQPVRQRLRRRPLGRLHFPVGRHHRHSGARRHLHAGGRRGFDLSIGAVATSALMLSAYVMVVMQQNAFVAVLACLLMGALVGLINGLLIVKTRVPDLLATLGMMFLLIGLQRIPTEGRSIATRHAPARRRRGDRHVLAQLPVDRPPPLRFRAARPDPGAGGAVHS